MESCVTAVTPESMKRISEISSGRFGTVYKYVAIWGFLIGCGPVGVLFMYRAVWSGICRECAFEISVRIAFLCMEK